MLLAKRIRKIRKQKGFTQKLMAERTGVEQSTYSGYEREAGNLKFTTITKIAEALECSVLFLTDIDSETYDYDCWKLGIG